MWSSSTHLLYHESGLLGVSGLSSSPQPLLAAEATNPRARAALELYVRRIVREIGALTAVLGGLDMLAFTAGIGEHSAVLRERICGALDWLGVRSTTLRTAPMHPTISDRLSRVRVVVEPTNEEWIAASHAQRVIRERRTGGGMNKHPPLPKGHTSILSPQFRYVPAALTDLAATFARIRGERMQPQPAPGEGADWHRPLTIYLSSASKSWSSLVTRRPSRPSEHG